jgi:hypothetical protein
MQLIHDSKPSMLLNCFLLISAHHRAIPAPPLLRRLPFRRTQHTPLRSGGNGGPHTYGPPLSEQLAGQVGIV